MKLASFILAASVLLPGAALAQSNTQAFGANPDCMADARSVCVRTNSGVLADARGQVLLSRGGGFSEIGSGTRLVAGDRLVVQNGSAAVVLAPACRAQLVNRAVYTLVQRGDTLCTARLQTAPNNVARNEPGVSPQAAAGIVGMSAVGSALVIANALQNDDTPPPAPISQPAIQ